MDNIYEKFLEACQTGDAEKVKSLLPNVDPKTDEDYALRLVAGNGHTEIVKLLLPVSDPKANDSEALQWAANNGHLEIVQLLIPVSDPKANDSQALRWVARNGNLEIVQLLWEHSEPKKALKIMIEEGLEEKDYFLIKQRLQAEEERKLIGEELKERVEKKPSTQKQKM